jgi:NTP pyrophosphatase (non-canonical NTP hydrolase)
MGRSKKYSTELDYLPMEKDWLQAIRDRLLQKTGSEVLHDIAYTTAYQQWVYSIWNYHDWDKKRLTIHDDYIMGTGLPGEVGEVLEIVKKIERDHVRDDPEAFAEAKLNLRLELGDVLYYLVMIAARHNISFDSIIKENVLKLEKRREKRLKKKMKKKGA